MQPITPLVARVNVRVVSVFLLVCAMIALFPLQAYAGQRSATPHIKSNKNDQDVQQKLNTTTSDYNNATSLSNNFTKKKDQAAKNLTKNLGGDGQTQGQGSSPVKRRH